MKRALLLCIMLIFAQRTYALEDYEYKSYFCWAMGVSNNNNSSGLKLHSSLRILFHTQLLNEKFKVGAEVNYNELDSWNVPGHISGPSAEDYFWSIQVLNDFILYQPKYSNLCFHSEFGYGLGDDTFRSEQVDMRLALSLKMVMSYGNFDFYMSSSRTIEKESIKMYSAGIGVTFPWE
jgi:hypothetical protein